MNTVRLRRFLLWLAGAIALYALVGFLAVPALVKRQAIVHVDRELGHRLELDEVRFNPFTLSAEVAGLRLSEATGAPLLSFQRLFVNLQASSLFRGAWTFDAVELDAPDIRFELRPDGRHNFSALLDRLKKPEPQPDEPLPRIEIARIHVGDGRLDVADLPAGDDARLTLHPVTFDLTEFSTLSAGTSPYMLAARTADGESIQWGGDATINPFSSAGKLALGSWQVSTLDRMLGKRIGLHQAAGQLDVTIDYRVAFAGGRPSVTLSNAALTVADLALVAAAGEAPLVGAGKLALTGGQFDLEQRTLGVERIAVEGGSVALALDREGRPNWTALLPKPLAIAPATHGTPETRAAAPAAATPSAEAESPWQLQLGRLDAADLAMAYTDRRAVSASSLAFRHGRIGLGAALTLGQKGLSGTVSDLTLGTGALAAERVADRIGVQSVQVAASALKLDLAADRPQVALEKLKLAIAGASGTAGRQTARIDGIDLAAGAVVLGLGAPAGALDVATVDAPLLELKGAAVDSAGGHPLAEVKAVSVGARRVRASLDREVAVDANGLHAELAALAVRESDGKAVAARLGKLQATGGSVSSSKRNAAFDRVVLADGHASASYAADGRLNWDRIVAQFVPPADTAAARAPGIKQAPGGKPAAPAPVWNIAAKLIEVDRFGAAYADARQQPPLAVEVQDVKARLRNLATSGQGRAGVELTGRLKDSGQFRVAGSVDPRSPAADLKLKLDGISLLPAQPFLAQHARLKIVAGLASAEGRLRYGLPKQAGARIVYEGQLGLDQLDVQESDPQQPFLALGSMRASQVKLTIGPNSLDVPDLRLDRLVTKLLIAEDQSINLLKVLRTPSDAAATEAPQGAPEAKPTQADAAADDEPFPVSIGRIRIDNSELEFADLSLRPQLFSTRMHELQGVVTGVSTSRDSRARLELDARVDEFGAATIRGSINPFRPRAYTEVDLDFRNIAMTNLSPYSTKFAGYQIASGQMSINLEYRVKNSGLKGNNRIILDNLQLGERVESPTAMNLPLEFAIAILKDSNGRIDIGLPVTGSLDDPQFSIAGLVWKAIGNLITGIVTAPFRALASLFGGGQDEQLGVVEFDPGSDALRPPERQKLRTVAEALQKRPQLKLTIKPTYTVEGDREALQSLAMRRAVLERAGIKLEPGEAPGPLDINNPRTQQAIEALYVERFGLPAARDLRASLAKPAPEGTPEAKPESGAAASTAASRQAVRIARSMSNQLMEATEIAEEDLAALGKRRSAAISGELQNTAHIDPQRLGTEAPRATDGKNGQVVSELELSVAKQP